MFIIERDLDKYADVNPLFITKERGANKSWQKNVVVL